PLDAFQKLFLENQVVLVKMNPVNDYLTEYLQAALKPLIDLDALRIVRGDGQAGAFLCDHPLVEELHITGAKVTHDEIVWGNGEEGKKNKAAGTPKNPRKISSELGAVCPTIVVPGPWSDADVSFQAENIATQKMGNSGYTCISMQNLILPEEWHHSDALLNETKRVIAEHTQRAPYYPNTHERLSAFAEHADIDDEVPRGDNIPACLIADIDQGDTRWLQQNEVFAPAMTVKRVRSADAETFLIQAIAWANENLYGTLGANIVIHPETLKEIGEKRFEEILTDLRYGAIGVNAWSGLAFLAAGCPWGGFAGATMNDIQSGIGTVHNSLMLEKTERSVVYAPFRPFPRNLLSGGMTLLPRPPWFVTNKRQETVGKLLTRFQHKPSWLKLPRIFLNALLG
ncbi:MAG: aldehyde dehydrogenase family protein, partial [Pseudomonadota bacterium]